VAPDLSPQALIASHGHLPFEEIVEYVMSFRPPYPEKPEKPKLKADHKSSDVTVYNKLLQKWESDMAKYENLKKVYEKEDAKLETVIDEYMKEETGFNQYVPDQYKRKVFGQAYSDGHSEGNSGIRNALFGLVDIFKPE
jgi:hypothetical protein